MTYALDYMADEKVLKKMIDDMEDLPYISELKPLKDLSEVLFSFIDETSDCEDAHDDDAVCIKLKPEIENICAVYQKLNGALNCCMHILWKFCEFAQKIQKHNVSMIDILRITVYCHCV